MSQGEIVSIPQNPSRHHLRRQTRRCEQIAIGVNSLASAYLRIARGGFWRVVKYGEGEFGACELEHNDPLFGEGSADTVCGNAGVYEEVGVTRLDAHGPIA